MSPWSTRNSTVILNESQLRLPLRLNYHCKSKMSYKSCEFPYAQCLPYLDLTDSKWWGWLSLNQCSWRAVPIYNHIQAIPSAEEHQLHLWELPPHQGQRTKKALQAQFADLWSYLIRSEPNPAYKVREIKYTATTMQRWDRRNLSRWAKCKESRNIRLLDSEDSWTTSEICLVSTRFGGFSQLLPWEKCLQQRCVSFVFCVQSTPTAEQALLLYNHTPLTEDVLGRIKRMLLPSSEA